MGDSPPDPERMLLGAMLADRQRVPLVATVVRPEDFSHPGLRALYNALREVDTAGGSFDLVALSAELRQRGALEGIGGWAGLVALETEAPTLLDVDALAHAVNDRGIRRQTSEQLGEVQSALKTGKGSANDVLADAHRRLAEIEGTRPAGDLVPMATVIDETLTLVEKMRDHKGGITGLPTGFIDLDRMLTGLHPGELIVLAARPGKGKTAIALNAAIHCALRESRGAAVFSLEMPKSQLGMRALASEGKVSLKRLRQGGLAEGDYGRVNDASARLYSAPLWIDDAPALSPFDLRTRLRRLRAMPGVQLGLVVVDYIQLMVAGLQLGSREQEVAFCSRSLKGLAKELGVPVLALAQLSRKAEERKGPPMLSDLRESGSLEQDADVVLFLHEEEESDEGEGMSADRPADEVKAVELVVAKQRNGPMGSVSLWLRPEFTRFESRARHEG